MDLSRRPNVIRDYATNLKGEFPQYKDTALNRIARSFTHFRKRNVKQKLRMIESMRSKRKKTEYVYAKPSASTRAAKAWAEKTNAMQEVVEDSIESDSESEIVAETSAPVVRKSQIKKSKKEEVEEAIESDSESEIVAESNARIVRRSQRSK